ncbi:hypothetical protein APS_1318 [Acetobacter pasteurianus subsp. pasteurianus LMG 1262 = NBRC 106471]|nr:hypothetical protein APS_1318 [Acetobacter pasteurianus subsp. pasteurianus LMG 1262 = NBRC 106471]
MCGGAGSVTGHGGVFSLVSVCCVVPEQSGVRQIYGGCTLDYKETSVRPGLRPKGG